MQRQQASAYSQDDIAKIAEVYQIYVSALIGVVIWDWVLNLPRERKLIWKARWSVGKVAYLFVRYMTTVLGVIFISVGTYGSFTSSACSSITKADLAIASVVTMGCEAILGLRTWSIWDCNKWLTAWLVFHWVAVLVILMVNVGISVQHLPMRKRRGSCFLTGTETFVSYWIATISYEIVTTALLTIRSVQLMGSESVAGRGFISAFTRDGLAYVFVVCVLNGINIGFVLQDSRPLIKGVNAGPTTFLTAVACCHLSLSLLQRNNETERYISTQDLETSQSTKGPRDFVRQLPLAVRRPASLAHHFHRQRLNRYSDHSQGPANLTTDAEGKRHSHRQRKERTERSSSLNAVRVHTEVEIHSDSEDRSIA